MKSQVDKRLAGRKGRAQETRRTAEVEWIWRARETLDGLLGSYC